jgi:cobalt transporter subunit CbtB
MLNVQSAADARSVPLSPARAAPIVAAFMLGVFVIAGAGFVSVPAVHNAAHDQRHAIGFPCH